VGPAVDPSRRIAAPAVVENDSLLISFDPLTHVSLSPSNRPDSHRLTNDELSRLRERRDGENAFSSEFNYLTVTSMTRKGSQLLSTTPSTTTPVDG